MLSLTTQHALNTSVSAANLLSDDALTRHIFIIHSAITSDIHRLLLDLNSLTVLAPDTHLDDLDRRVERLKDIVLAHCLVEDETLFPILQSSLNKPSSPSTPCSHPKSSPPPAKRPRTSYSPVAVDLHLVQEEHSTLHQSFRDVRTAISVLRATPLHHIHSRTHSPPRLSHKPFTSTHPPSSFSPQLSLLHQTRQECITRVSTTARNLSSTIRAHLDCEELHILPSYFHALSIHQRAALLLQVTNAALAVPLLCDALGNVPEDDLAKLCNALAAVCSPAELQRIASRLASAMSSARWISLCSKVPRFPKMVSPQRTPLVGILHIHKAIVKELNEIMGFCISLDLSHPKQLSNLTSRFDFLRRVHQYHAMGEDTVLLKELNAKLRSCVNSEAIIDENHEDESALFREFSVHQAKLLEKAQSKSQGIAELKAIKEDMIKSVRNISDFLIAHMKAEEREILPLLQKLFSVEEQNRMMRSVRAVLPGDLLQDVIPWVFNALDMNDREDMLRSILTSARKGEGEEVVRIFSDGVFKGKLEREDWNEIRQRVPEMEEKFRVIDKDEEDGPVSEILRVHKAFRIELNAILRTCKEFDTDGSSLNPHVLVSLAEGVAFLRLMVFDHSQAEDNIILPRLEQRVAGISGMYKDDHVDEMKLFQDLADCIGELRCGSDGEEVSGLVRKLHALAQTLRDEMEAHLRSEEEHMWPVLKEHFTVEEQTETVAMIFGQLSGSRLRELLPWMIRKLSVSEGNTMMNHILQVTRSTMFETWLKTWLPLDKEDLSKTPIRSAESLPKSTDEDVKAMILNAQEAGPSGATTARLMLYGRDNMQRTIRSIAQNESLSVETRTRMMQDVMLAPYNQLRCGDEEGEKKNEDQDDLTRTYMVGRDGKKKLGCRHYSRACKLRSSCCGMLFTCRLCHDDAVQTHIMDRYATKEILCMYCQILQRPSATCINEKCGKRFAKYFCEICVFYDDNPSRNIYHCHSCNVCRAGKGLGKDFFHCMKCNQCMSMKYRHSGHVCVEKAMESNCPVCHLFLFTSTKPVKHLACGHLMHASCFTQYRNRTRRMQCPVCSKSLEEMKPVFLEIDKQIAAGGSMSMPEEYRTARCDMFCLDCGESSNTPYHFVFNKCPKCSSFNTRVGRIDANAGDRTQH